MELKYSDPIEYELNRLYAYLKFYTNVDFAEDANLAFTISTINLNPPMILEKY